MFDFFSAYLCSRPVLLFLLTLVSSGVIMVVLIACVIYVRAWLYHSLRWR